MTKVYFVKASRKDHPEGIKKGESYYRWSFRVGGTHRSKTYPRPSQLTASDKLSRLYAAQESVQDACEAKDSNVADLELAVEQAIAEVMDVAEEYRCSAEIIRESFSESPTADACDEKADAAESYASDLEAVNFDEAPCDDDPDTWGSEDNYKAAFDSWWEAATGDILGADFNL